jgi:cellulose synthase operon protein C
MNKHTMRRWANQVALVGVGVGLSLFAGQHDAWSKAPATPTSDIERWLPVALHGQGTEPYAALREIWRLWDQENPALVEEAITEVAVSTQVKPPIRAYAGLLKAYARRRRGDLAGAEKRVTELGFVREWLVVGPFDNEAKGSLYTPFGPEQDLSAPIVPGQSYEGKERRVFWRKPAQQVFRYGWADFGVFVRPAQKVCVYGTSLVRVRPQGKRPAGQRQASLWMGSSGSFRAFWNSQEVLVDQAYRALDADRWAAKITIKPGWNRLTVKNCSGDDGAILQARIAKLNGEPDPDIETSVELERFKAAQSNAVVPSKASKTVRKDKGIRIVDKGDPYAKGALNRGSDTGRAPEPFAGALAGLRAVQDAKKPSARELEAYARYLSLTGGDDANQHTARDLAFRAAKSAPTVDRLLLAGRLAEDRNSQKVWVKQARALVKPGEDDSAVLLAEALLARRGPNFRDATPYFNKLLAQNPQHIAGLLGRVELYNEAGLKYTSLATLKDAAIHHPHVLAILRTYSEQLRALGRSTEAQEVERQYAHLRFDDVGFLHQKIRLSVARRDKESASRWLERLLEVDPDSSVSLAIAANSYRSLGDPTRALAYHQKRLELAPEDVEAMRDLADFYGEQGKRSEQLKLLRQILVLRPQAKDVREYVESILPPKKRSDEAFAWGIERVKELAKVPAPKGILKRTLRNLQVTTVYANGLSSRFHQVVFQPLTNEEAASSRQYGFGYQGDREIVDVRSAKVYHKNGKVDEAIEMATGPADDPSIAMYTSARTFFIQLPRIEPGDIVDLQYRVEDIAPRNEFGSSFSETTYLQAMDPISSGEYVLITPKSKKIQIHGPQMPQFKSEKKIQGENQVFRLFGTNVPAISPEPRMPPLPEVVANVSVSTFKDWNEVGSWYWGLAKDQFDADDEVRKKVKEITKGLKTNEEKIRAVYGYVVQRTRYVALEFGIEGFKPRRCALTLGRGWGDCKDKATVIVTMLRELGIPATIVLVRTNMRGDASTTPASYTFFDHAIAYVPELKLFLDGTAEYTGMNELPPFDRGAWGLLVNEGKPKLVQMPDPKATDTVRERQIDVTILDKGPASVKLDVKTTGAIAAAWRQRYHAKATQRSRITNDFSGSFGGFTLGQGKQSVKINDLENIEQPVQINLQGKASRIAKGPSGTITITPTPVGSLVSSYASLSQRKFDIKLPYAFAYQDNWTVHLPKSMHIEHMPASTLLKSQFGMVSLKIEKKANEFTIKVAVHIEKTRIKAADYKKFQDFCKKADHILGDAIQLTSK